MPGGAGTFLQGPGGHHCAPDPLGPSSHSLGAVSGPGRLGWAGLGTAPRVLQPRVRRLQWCHAWHQAQLRILQQLAQQLRGQSLQAQAHRGLVGAVSAAYLPRHNHSSSASPASMLLLT